MAWCRVMQWSNWSTLPLAPPAGGRLGNAKLISTPSCLKRLFGARTKLLRGGEGPVALVPVSSPTVHPCPLAQTPQVYSSAFVLPLPSSVMWSLHPPQLPCPGGSPPLVCIKASDLRPSFSSSEMPFWVLCWVGGVEGSSG